MPSGQKTEAPVAFLEMCVRSPIDCWFDREPVMLASTSARASAALRLARASAIKLSLAASVRADASRGHAAAPAVLTAFDDAFAAAPGASPVAPQSARGAAASGPSAPADLDRMLATVNDRVNGAMKMRSDRSLYGVDDYWVAPIASGLAPAGDCEDFALEKRRELITAGVDARLLYLAIADTPWGEMHAALVATTRDGDVVLDSLDRRILRWDRTPYRWVARQSADDPVVWVSVGA
jgi:predicted transglutaminase-like cysteine proteinase